MFDEVGFLLAMRSTFEKHSAGSAFSALSVSNSQQQCSRVGETPILQSKDHSSQPIFRAFVKCLCPFGGHLSALGDVLECI